MKKIIILFIGLATFFSCEEQMVVVPDFILPTSDRVVLIEELTGVDCPNCPAGASKVKELFNLYGDLLVGYAVHGDFLAAPVTGSQYDFRNQDGRDLEGYFAPFLGKPCAVINREQFDDQNFWSITTIDLWQSYIDRQFSKPSKLNLSVSTEYDPNSRRIDLTANLVATDEISGDLRISAVLTESHIIDAQKDQDQIIPDYEHNHALREILNDNFAGDQLGSNLANGDTASRSYSFTLPEEDGTWVAENMELVVFATQIIDGTEEVIQATSTYFAE